MLDADLRMCAATSWVKMDSLGISMLAFFRIKELRRAKRAAEMSKEILDLATESVKNAQQAVLAAEAAVVNITREETDMVVQSRLKTAEARHKEGKRIEESNMNIIPHDSEGNKLVWKPKNMAFGMNK